LLAGCSLTGAGTAASAGGPDWADCIAWDGPPSGSALCSQNQPQITATANSSPPVAPAAISSTPCELRRAADGSVTILAEKLIGAAARFSSSSFFSALRMVLINRTF
jgi:hypothetical protein